MGEPTRDRWHISGPGRPDLELVVRDYLEVDKLVQRDVADVLHYLHEHDDDGDELADTVVRTFLQVVGRQIREHSS